MDKSSRLIAALAILAFSATAPSPPLFAQATPESQQTTATAAQAGAMTSAAMAPAPAAQARATPAAAEEKTAILLAPEIKRRDTLPDAVPTPAVSPTPTAGQVLFNRTHDASVMDPLCWGVVIHKSRHE